MSEEQTLAQLYAKDPHNYSDQDLLTVVTKLREQYRAAKAGNLKAGTQPKRKLTEKEDAAVKAAGGLDTIDLGDL